MKTGEETGSRLDLTELVRVARTHLYWLFGEAPAVASDILRKPALQRVNITLRTRGQVRGSMSGHGKMFREQLLDAVNRACRDARFAHSIVKADLDEISVEVWLQVSSKLIPVEDRESEDAIEFGQDGIEAEQGPAFAYYKPSVALTGQFESPQIFFSALCKKAYLPADAWKYPNCQLRRTRWVHLCETSDGNIVEMNALRVKKTLAITAESMARWAQSGVSYFKANQHFDGSFCYRYRPFLDSARREDSNPVRASGCAYAMASAVSSTKLVSDRETKECAKRAVAAILLRSTRLECGGTYIADKVGDPPRGKLGTTALLVLALLTQAFRAEHEEEIKSLMAGMKSLQSSDGMFECTIGQHECTESQINFFPGQALLALVVRAEQGDESCRDHYRRSFVPYRDHFRRSPATAFVGWHVDVWSRAALLDSSTEYAEFVFSQIDWLLQFQIQGDKQQLATGGFSWNGKPPNYSSIVYTEAIARGGDLAYRLGDSRWFTYRDAFRAGLEFCSRLRLTKEQSIFFPHPARAVGGMTKSLSDFEVRSDVVQHSIMLALAALDCPALLDGQDGSVM